MKLKKELEFNRQTQVAVWSALEALTAPELEARRQGFQALVDQDVVRKSPLVVYLLATRLLEPDLHLRLGIVRSLASLLSPSPGDPPVAGAVLTYLHSYLSQMRTRPIFALLQVAAFDPDTTGQVGALLKACSFAGNHLAQIITDRQAPLAVRRQAISFASKIGFLAVIPALERMIRRLESRQASAEALSLGSADQDGEFSLLPYLQEALERLRAI